MRILITGAKGRLGSKLMALLSPDHTVTGIDVDSVDITERARVQQVVGDTATELVLHCAAMTQVDECARQPDLALRINAYGTHNVALACMEHQAEMLYVSTNEVFDGTSSSAPYLEYDPARPINPYGYSKWVGEQMVRQHLTRFYIARTSWLFAHGGRNFIQAILARANEGQPLRVVVNEVGVPTYNDDLAVAITQLLQTRQYGAYHLVNEGQASRWDFAREILNLTGHADLPIEKITLADYPRPSTPPEQAVLRNFAAAHLGIRLRPWQEALHDYLNQEGLLA